MAAQKDYGWGTPKGVAGGKVDIGFDDVIARNNEADDGVIKYGMAVAVGTDAGYGVKAPDSSTTADQIEGVVICHPGTEQDMKGKVVVKNNATLSIMRKGRIWGRTASDATPKYGEKAYVVKDGADAGAFTSESSDTLDIGAKFGKYTDDGIAVIELD